MRGPWTSGPVRQELSQTTAPPRLKKKPRPRRRRRRRRQPRRNAVSLVPSPGVKQALTAAGGVCGTVTYGNVTMYSYGGTLVRRALLCSHFFGRILRHRQRDMYLLLRLGRRGQCRIVWIMLCVRGGELAGLSRIRSLNDQNKRKQNNLMSDAVEVA